MDIKNVTETISMIEEQNFDIRTITMGISLLDCIDPDIGKACDKIYAKITTKAKDLVRVGGDSGKPVSFYEPNSVTAKRYESAAARLWEIIENINNGGGADNSAIQPVNDGKSACSK